MIESLFTTLNEGLAASLWLGIVAAVFWGIASILLSPCHLASIPLLIGFISSQESANARRVFWLSVTFALGILVTIAAIGLATAMLGRLLGDIGMVGNVLVALVFLAIGLYLMDILPLSWNGLHFSGQSYSGLLSALTLGLIFGIGLGPCTFAFMAPVLGVVFKTATTNVGGAVTLLGAFALGHCAVIVVAGVLASRIGDYLSWTERSGVTRWIKRICGALVILGGLYMVWKLF
ncbi:MAG TPA: cytochrome c biogenesis protein CcdA [bacterium]|jgi:cytochrome c-type biogenesis protein